MSQESTEHVAEHVDMASALGQEVPVRYAKLFTGKSDASQTKTDAQLIWAGIDWDARVRTPFVVAMVDPAMAAAMRALQPIADSSHLAPLTALFPSIVAALETELRAAQTAAGWNFKKAAQSIPMQAANKALCRGAWDAFAGSMNGVAWRVAETLEPSLAVTLAACNVGRLGQISARTAAWRAQGPEAVQLYAVNRTWDPASLTPALSPSANEARGAVIEFVASF